MNNLNVAISHDVDRIKKTYHYLSKSLRAFSKLDLKTVSFHLEEFFNNKDTFWNFDEIIAIENKYQIKSTFFFLNESIPFNIFSIKNWPLSLGRYKITDPRIIEIIKYLDQNKFEIGVHGSYNSYNSLDLLKKEKCELEQILNKEIIGIRQHHLKLGESTWDLQYSAGFKYDSSYGSNKTIGYLNNKTEPFNPQKNSFKVFPMVLMDKTFCADPNKWENLKEIIKISKENKSVLVLNWHTDTFHEKEYPGFKSDFIRIIETLNSQGANYDTLGNYYKKMLTCAE